MRELLRLDHLAPGRFSAVLLEDLALLLAQGANPGAVVEEIEHLERPKSVPTRTKPSAPLRFPLLGLHHKHYQLTTADSLLINLRAEAKAHKPELTQTIYDGLRAAEKSDFETVADVAGKIAGALVSDAYNRRRADSRLTGEWIVYVTHEQQNFYICLAVHGDDAHTRAKVDRVVGDEWPFLRALVA